MQRFFAKTCGGEAFFSPSEAVAAEGGEVYLARLVSREPLKALLLRPLREDDQFPSSLYFGFSLLKGGHDEPTPLKGTKFGVAGFLPFLSERTVIRLEEWQREKRRLRFRRIVEKGAKRSKRAVVPMMAAIRLLSATLKEEAEVKATAYEGEKENAASLRLAPVFSFRKEGR
ncbi:MAG: RsmE family RNA methyltransferase [Bacilli bacterium]|jgi:16S rRNA (uracil1498-N3)-methyltransferase|nr:RsmE family RNA methyltransferase [Bacilli bacterium]